MYGDAADVWINDDGSGWIDDLNGDGRRDVRDMDVILEAVDIVESRQPSLTGGVGRVSGPAGHLPFHSHRRARHTSVSPKRTAR